MNYAEREQSQDRKSGIKAESRKQKGEIRKEKSASKREQNKFIYYVEPTQERTQNQVYLNYVERQGGRQDVNSEQIQDRKAGLKETCEA